MLLSTVYCQLTNVNVYSLLPTVECYCIKFITNCPVLLSTVYCHLTDVAVYSLLPTVECYCITFIANCPVVLSQFMQTASAICVMGSICVFI